MTITTLIFQNILPLLARQDQLMANRTTQIFTWIGVLMAATIVLAIIVAAIRKRYHDRNDLSGNIGYTIADLRDLHKRGELTDEEFAAAKSLIIEQSKINMDKTGSVDKKANFDNIATSSTDGHLEYELGEELLDVDNRQDEEENPDSSDKNTPDA